MIIGLSSKELLEDKNFGGRNADIVGMKKDLYPLHQANSYRQIQCIM